MDKSVILAVAGSGKTTMIVEKLNLTDRFLLITYTVNNTKNLKHSIIKKFGYFPDNITLFSYFNFLYSFCFRPFLAYKLKPRGIYWNSPPDFTSKLPLKNKKRFFSSNGLLYHNRIAKLLELFKINEEINKRIAKYYDHLFIDEIQDFAGHDFNLLQSICKTQIDILLVGDFYQHTFDTSRDGRTNSTLHDDYIKYQKKFELNKVKPNTTYLNKSHRCSKSVCAFISDQIGINIQTHKTEDSKVSFVDNPIEIEQLFCDDSIVKLFYREHFNYDCFSQNWGACKGENNFNDVCVVLNKATMTLYKNDKLSELKPMSKNKLYVACSRANKNLYLIPEESIEHHKK